MTLPGSLATALALLLLMPPVLGCASSNRASNPNVPAQSGSDPAAQTDPTTGGTVPTPTTGGPSVGTRAQSALEGALMGAIIGGQAGPIGAAVGAGTLLLYSALTGQVPFQGSGGPGNPGGSERDREESLEGQIEDEVTRQASLESEIEEELRRQEELLAKIEREESVRRTATPAPAAAAQQDGAPDLAQQADPRIAAVAPTDRDLPITIFEEKRITVPKGAWGNEKKLAVLARALDADRDGKPEEVRYFDAQTGVIVRKEEDRNFDGAIDSWSLYEGGVLVERSLDESGDAKPDAWERYAVGRMISREVDRDADGVRDAFYRYEGDSLVLEQHDSNNDGKVDLAIRFENRRRVSTEEDQDRDGAMDTWTRYVALPDGTDAIARMEHDKKRRGKPDTFETYAYEGGKTVLLKREEDVNGDGSIDVTSVYEGGKLLRREISDPAIVPL